jgi:hypothetical protein
MNKVKCPQCGSQDVIRIVYGFPSSQTIEKAEKGEIKLGGCVVHPDNPNLHCKHCHFEFKGGAR